jgi:hypothetical protein
MSIGDRGGNAWSVEHCSGRYKEFMSEDLGLQELKDSAPRHLFAVFAARLRRTHMDAPGHQSPTGSPVLISRNSWPLSRGLLKSNI